MCSQEKRGAYPRDHHDDISGDEGGSRHTARVSHSVVRDKPGITDTALVNASSTDSVPTPKRVLALVRTCSFEDKQEI